MHHRCGPPSAAGHNGWLGRGGPLVVIAGSPDSASCRVHGGGRGRHCHPAGLHDQSEGCYNILAILVAPSGVFMAHADQLMSLPER